MVRGWIETHGDVAWELDALEPKELMKIVDSAIEKHFDRKIWNERCYAVAEGQKKVKQLIGDYLGV